MKKIFYRKIKRDKDLPSRQVLSASKQAGMTLVELMVVLGIFMIVAGLTIFDYGKFRSTVSLQNLADDIALSVRRAQNYAIGVRSSQSSVFTNGYGIHFTTATSSSDVLSGTSKSFIVFSDISLNRAYNYPAGNASCGSPTAGNECVDVLTITSADYISSICPNSVPANCASGSSYTDISFLRPDPDAYIYACTPTCNTYSSIDIIIKNSQSGSTKTITISNTGQISIK
ncbi:MAG: prepilin-type N-terminal cleavage/methylation domain-containing protein [Patescibacteria group bacterium]